jgi:hypothetical protein
MTPSTAYADTFLITSTAFAVDHNKHLSFYNQINVTATNSSSIGSDNAAAGWCRMSVKSGSNASIVFGGTNGTGTVANVDSRGFYIANRPTSATSQLYKNGSLVVNGSSANGTSSQLAISLLIGAARSSGAIVYYDNKQCSFASIGDSLTQSEASDQFNIVEQYQRDNGRGTVVGFVPTTEIGTGTSSNYEMPFKGIYHYSISASIYLQSELGNLPKRINSIQFYFAGFTTPYTVTNQEIWIAEVAQSSFDTAPAVDFSDLTITNLTQVKTSFTHTVTANNQWYQFDFNTPFTYNGTSNLIVIWKNYDGSATISGAGYGRTTSATNRGMYKFNDPSFPTGDGTRINEILNAKFIWDFVD